MMLNQGRKREIFIQPVMPRGENVSSSSVETHQVVFLKTDMATKLVAWNWTIIQWSTFYKFNLED